MKKNTENAIRTLLRLDSTVTPEVRMAVIGACRGEGAALPNGLDRDLSVAEAAELLGLSRTTIWRQCREGSLKCVRRGKKYYIKASEIASKKEVA